MTKRRTFAAILSALMVASLTAGCGNKNSTADIAPEDLTDIGPMEKYEEPITVRMACNIDTGFSQTFDSLGMDYENNPWIDTLRDDYGINIKYEFMASADDYTTKLNATVASGELLDIGGYDSIQLAQLKEADLLVDQDPMIEKYGSDLLKEMIYGDGGLAMDCAKVDGVQVSIPYMCDPRPEVVFYRQDWLDKLGLEVPKTMDDVRTVAHAISTQDPDGNGVDDTFGISLSKMISAGIGSSVWFFNGYHAYPKQWIEQEDGSIVYGSTLPEMKDALTVLQQMYKDGDIDPEFITKDDNKVGEDAAAQKTGIAGGQWWAAGWPLDITYESNPDVDVNWKAYPIPSCDDQPAKPQYGATGIAPFYAVRKGYEHPEALVKIFNVWWELMYGKDQTEEEFYTYSTFEDGGISWKFSPVWSFPGEDMRGHHIDAALRANDSTGLTIEEKTIFDQIQRYWNNGETSLRYQNGNYGLDNPQMILTDVYFASGNATPPAFYGAPTSTMSDKWSTLEKMEEEIIVKIIMGEEPVEAYDQFVEEWNKLGGEQITKEVNEWAKAQK